MEKELTDGNEIEGKTVESCIVSGYVIDMIFTDGTRLTIEAEGLTLIEGTLMFK